MSRLESLRQRGFDQSTFHPNPVEGPSWRPRCSQCEALVINGVACHEAGCPNSRRVEVFEVTTKTTDAEEV